MSRRRAKRRCWCRRQSRRYGHCRRTRWRSGRCARRGYGGRRRSRWCTTRRRCRSRGWRRRLVISDTVEALAGITLRITRANPRGGIVNQAHAAVCDITIVPAITGVSLTSTAIKCSGPDTCGERQRSSRFVADSVDRRLTSHSPQRTAAIGDDASIHVVNRLRYE